MRLRQMRCDARLSRGYSPFNTATRPLPSHCAAIDGMSAATEEEDLEEATLAPDVTKAAAEAAAVTAAAIEVTGRRGRRLCPAVQRRRACTRAAVLLRSNARSAG